MNTMTLEEIQNKIEELEAEIEEKQELIKKFEEDEYDNNVIMLQISDRLKAQSDN